MKNYNFFALIKIIFWSILLISITGCIDLNDSQNINDNNVNEVIVNINLPKARNLIDYIISQTTSYKLTVTKNDVEVFSNTFSSDQASISVKLTEGLHHFILEAFNGNVLIGVGNAESILIIGQNQVNITLRPVDAYVDINVGWELQNENQVYSLDGKKLDINGNIKAYFFDSISLQLAYTDWNIGTITNGIVKLSFPSSIQPNEYITINDITIGHYVMLTVFDNDEEVIGIVTFSSGSSYFDYDKDYHWVEYIFSDDNIVLNTTFGRGVYNNISINKGWNEIHFFASAEAPQTFIASNEPMPKSSRWVFELMR